MRRPLVACLFLVVACNAAAPGPAPAVTTTATTALPSAEEAIGVFSDCLNEQGVEVDAIPTGPDGRPDLSSLAGVMSQDPLRWRSALSACAGGLVGSGALDLSADPELASLVIGQLQAFAQCMRGQGVEDFPDPAPDFDGTAAPFHLAEIPVTDPELATAVESCAAMVGANPLG